MEHTVASSSHCTVAWEPLRVGTGWSDLAWTPYLKAVPERGGASVNV